MIRMLALLTAATLSSFAPSAASGGTLAPAAPRWDAIGHRAMAAMAYDRLRPATRGRVDELLRVHPDIASLAENLDINTAAGIREVFLRARCRDDQVVDFAFDLAVVHSRPRSSASKDIVVSK